METISITVPEGLKDQVEEYQYQHRIDSKSGAWRELTRYGLQSQQVRLEADNE